MNEVYFQIAVLLYTSLAFAITRASMYVSPCWTQFFIIILLVVLILPLVWLLIRMVSLVRVYLLKVIYDLRLNKRPAGVILYLPCLVLDVCKVFNLA